AMLQGVAEGGVEQNIFDIVNQLNQGSGLLTSPEEKIQLASLNSKAGDKAKDSASYASALQYLSKALTLLGDDPWASQFPLTMKIYDDLAICEFMNRNHKRAEQLFDLVISKAQTKEEK